MEIWKDVVGFEQSYEVSNIGRVRSKFRIVLRSNGRPHTTESKVLSPTIRGKNGGRPGYFAVFISSGLQGKKGKHYNVHRLVANAFIENPENKKEINHIDSNTFNNKVDNLEWCTKKENQVHSCLAGRRSHLMKKVAIKNMEGEVILFVPNIKVASIITGANRTAIKEVSKGKNTHAKGLKFEIISNENHRNGVNTVGRLINNKPVVQLDKTGAIINIFNSFKEAAASVGFSPTALVSARKGRLKTIKGFKWAFPGPDEAARIAAKHRFFK